MRSRSCADDWCDVLEFVVADTAIGRSGRIFFTNAVLAIPDVEEYLEADSFQYAIPLSANKILQQKFAHLLKRLVGRPPTQV